MNKTETIIVFILGFLLVLWIINLHKKEYEYTSVFLQDTKESSWEEKCRDLEYVVTAFGCLKKR